MALEQLVEDLEAQRAETRREVHGRGEEDNRGSRGAGEARNMEHGRSSGMEVWGVEGGKVHGKGVQGK